MSESQGTEQTKNQVEVEQMVQNLTLEEPRPQNKEQTATDIPQKQVSQSQQQSSVNAQQQSDQLQPQAQPETAQFVKVNRNVVQFGRSTLFPGSIEQVDVNIELNQQTLQPDPPNHPFLLRVIARCSEEQFNELEEYVFSVRSNQRFEYFEEVRFKIRIRERAQIKVAVKIPSVKNNHKITGELQIQLEHTKPLLLPIIANCQIPEVVCLKKLFKVDENTSMIKIPAKKNQIRMPPIPFKNMSNFNFTMEVQAITNQNFTKRPYDIIVQNFVNCQANTQFFVNLQLKENMNYQGPMPTKDTIRKILVMKIKNSEMFFNFPIEVQVFQSSNNNSMS